MMESSHKNRMTRRQSVIGLNAINFFQAEMVGVVLPALAAYLKEAGWRYDSIGIATALAGLGTLLLQTIAGEMTDRISSRRCLFAFAALWTRTGASGTPCTAQKPILTGRQTLAAI